MKKRGKGWDAMITHKMTVEELEYKNIKKGKQKVVLGLNNETLKILEEINM